MNTSIAFALRNPFLNCIVYKLRARCNIEQRRKFHGKNIFCSQYQKTTFTHCDEDLSCSSAFKKPSKFDERMGVRLNEWFIPCSDAVHVVEFSHDPITERRTIKVDGDVIKNYHHNSKEENFDFHNMRFRISIKTKGRLDIEYAVTLNGKPLDSYVSMWKSTTNAWHTILDGRPTRIVLSEYYIWIYARLIEVGKSKCVNKIGKL